MTDTEPEHGARAQNEVKNPSGVQKEPEQFLCPSCPKSFPKFNSLRGHVLGKHGRSLSRDQYDSVSKIPAPPEDTVQKEPRKHLTKTQKPVEPIVEEVYEEETEELVEQPIGEPLPTELDYLNTLLLEHGVRKRAVVLRALDLREPTNFYVLVDALTDVGVNKARQRRICEDYGAWMGKAIPEDIVEELRPDGEVDYSQQRSRRWGRRAERGQPDRVGEIVETFRAVKDILQQTQPRQSTFNQGNEALERRMEALEADKKELAKDNKELREQLSDEKIEGLRKEFDAKLASKNDGVATMISKLEKPVTRMGDLMEKVVGGVFETEFPKKPPKRKKLGEPTILEITPEELIEG